MLPPAEETSPRHLQHWVFPVYQLMRTHKSNLPRVLMVREVKQCVLDDSAEQLVTGARFEPGAPGSRVGVQNPGLRLGPQLQALPFSPKGPFVEWLF